MSAAVGTAKLAVMSDRWDPTQYARFADHRLRPALELLARVHHDDPHLIHDAGCGRGEVARLMAIRWPKAVVIGSDASADMLGKAAAIAGRVQWSQLDLREWAPEPEHDVIYANAVLHWLDDHRATFLRLFAGLSPGGVLAVQMPLSWYEPSHQALRDALAGAAVPEELRRRLTRRNVEQPGFYFDLLRPLATDLDIWTTTYLQVLDGPSPVLEWMKGSILRPVIDELDGARLDAFMAALDARLAAAYPLQLDGTTLYRFPRLFVVARR